MAQRPITYRKSKKKGQNETWKIFKFSTLEYKRPDFEKTGAFAEEITEKIKNAASYGELKGYMETEWRVDSKFDGLYDRIHPPYIRHYR